MISYTIITPSELEDIAGQVQGTFYSDGDNLVENINTAILNAIETHKAFSVFVEMRAPAPSIYAPPEVMFLHQEYRGRGFFTKYEIRTSTDGEGDETKSGLFTVSWANPDMTSQDIKSRPYWNLGLLEQLGKGARAFEYYLCLTGGVDLRRFTQNQVIKDINKQLTVNALQANRVISYNGPEGSFIKTTETGNTQLDSAAALSNLYAETIDFLTEHEFTVVDTTIPWTISS